MSLMKKPKATCRKSNDLKPKECCAHVTAVLDQHLTIPIQGNLTQTDVFGTVVGIRSPRCWSMCLVRHRSATISRNSIWTN